MQVSEQRIDGAVVFVPEGRIDNDTSAAFQSELMARVSAPDAKVVIDFAGVDYISSAGLRVLMMAAKTSKAGNGRIAVAAPTDVVREIFAISRFSHVLDIFDTRQEALVALA